MSDRLKTKKEAVLSVRDLTVIYQVDQGFVRAATEISFDMAPGAAIGLWGQSGCGKSTIIRALSGLLSGSPGWVGGRVDFLGQPASPDPRRFVSLSNGYVAKDETGFAREHARCLGPLLGRAWRVMFQEPIYSFEPWVSVGEQAREYFSHLGRTNGESPKTLEEEFAAGLTELGLDYSLIRNKLNLQLSGGECQRISLAMNIVGSPVLLLADEPTTAMDVDTRRAALRLIERKRNEVGTAVIIVSHNREELTTLADEILVICDGRQVERFASEKLTRGTPSQFHPYTRHLWFALGDTEVLRPDGGVSGQGCPYRDRCSLAQADEKLRRRCSAERPPSRRIDSDHSISCWHFWHNDTTGQADEKVEADDE